MACVGNQLKGLVVSINRVGKAKVMSPLCRCVTVFGLGLSLYLACVVVMMGWRHIFHAEEPSWLFSLVFGASLYGFQKLLKAKCNAILFGIAAIGYLALICFVAWIFRGAFAQ